MLPGPGASSKVRASQCEQAQIESDHPLQDHRHIPLVHKFPPKQQDPQMGQLPLQSQAQICS